MELIHHSTTTIRMSDNRDYAETVTPSGAMKMFEGTPVKYIHNWARSMVINGSWEFVPTDELDVWVKVKS